MKYRYVENNPFMKDMIFRTYIEVGKFLGLKDLKHGNTIVGAMKHYCEWHRDSDGMIHIDSVFENVVPFREKGFKYEIGNIITTNTGKFVIEDRYIGEDLIHVGKNLKTNIYKCRCLIDDYIFELPESRITFGIGCPLCGNRKLIPGIKTLYDTHPEIIKYLVNPEEAKNLTPNSGKMILCKCPECGTLKYMIVSNLVKYGFSCAFCSDHVSYPNKFVREFLRQLNMQYIPEKSFTWSCGKIYDQYIGIYDMIIENHGIQHYEEINSKNRRSLTDEKNNDQNKFNMAINNGIKYYIILDCRKSEKEWIKNSIMNSELVGIFKFAENDIDWDKCHSIACSNSEIKQICEAYLTNNNITDLSNIFHHNKHTISKYLQIGALCGYCEFEKNNSNKNGRANLWEINAKPIYCESDDIYFMSRKDVEKYYKQHGIKDFNGAGLYSYINKRIPYKQKKFIYITKKEYNYKYDLAHKDDSICVIGDRKYLDKYIKEE